MTEQETKARIENHKLVCQQGIARLQAALSWLESVPFLGTDDMYAVGEAIDKIKDCINKRKSDIALEKLPVSTLTIQEAEFLWEGKLRDNQ